MPTRDNVTPISAVEAEATGKLGEFELCGNLISIPPVNKWRSSALKALNNGDFETWAQRTLSPEDFKVWTDIDPTLEEVDLLFQAAQAFLGTNPGNSKASRR
jgi:hypothetical protein